MARRHVVATLHSWTYARGRLCSAFEYVLAAAGARNFMARHSKHGGRVARCRTQKRRGASETVSGAAQWMPPVHPPMPHTHGPHVMQVTMFLPQFVRKKKCDDEQRHDEEYAQYQLLDHGGLRSQEHNFIVEHRACRAEPKRAAASVWRSEASALPGVGDLGGSGRVRTLFADAKLHRADRAGTARATAGRARRRMQINGSGGFNDDRTKQRTHVAPT